MTEEIVNPSYKNVSKYEHKCKKCLDRNLLVECECGCHELMFRRDKHGKTRYFLRGHIVRVSNTKPKKSRTSNKDKFNCKKCRDQNWIIECACGCGGVLNRCNKDGYVKKFIMNHHMNLNEFKRDQTGEKNANYNGGMYFDDGYWMLTNKWDHPNSQKSDGAISRHVWNFTVREGTLFCCMLPWGIVHHKVPIDKGGTDDLQNLEGMMRNKHIGYHQHLRPRPKKNQGDRICLLCESIDTYIDKNTGYEHWYEYKNGFICNRCYKKIGG